MGKRRMTLAIAVPVGAGISGRTDCNDSPQPTLPIHSLQPRIIRRTGPFARNENVQSLIHTRRGFLTLAVALLLGCALGASLSTDAQAGPWSWFHRHHDPDGPPLVEVGGEWHWVRSPDEEKVVVSSLFNRYCIRCHGIDGRGVWDIPGVPDFTNAHWQATRTDAMFARRIIEGRGAVMPQFRGTLSLEEAWAMSRYLRTFIPGTEISPPVLPTPKKLADTPKK